MRTHQPDRLTPWSGPVYPGGGVLTYLAERGCAALMGRFFTRNP